MIIFAAMDPIPFHGQLLTFPDIVRMTQAPISLSAEMWGRIEKSKTTLDQLLAKPGSRYYGVNTGFGMMYSIGITPDDIQQLQVNLLRSHACGTGAAAPMSVVRLTQLLKIISLAQGYSGVSRGLVQAMIDHYNQGILPVVPAMGSLGASGDLAPLAHLLLPLIGEGEVVYKREQMPAGKALALAGLEPVRLQAKEGLALINGTQYSLAWLVNALENASRLADVADLCAAMSMDAFDAHRSPLDPGIHAVRDQMGQVHSANQIAQWLEGSELLTAEKKHLQDPYSFRCAPQVHGATRDVIDHVMHIANREINAVTDNPLVLGEGDDARIVSGGNFHAQPLALAADYLALAIAELGSISERRAFLMVAGQRGLPPALAKSPGLESGLMICQYTAASLVNRNKILSHPASTDSITSSGGQEDHVSMAANAGIKLFEIVNNTWTLLAIEWLIAAEAMESRRPLKTSSALEEKLMTYRMHVPALTGDRILSPDMDQAEKFLRQLRF